MKIALIQMPVTDDKAQNLAYAAEAVAWCAEQGARVIALPEMFMCPYQNDWFVRFAEPAGGETHAAMARMARESGIWLVGGSVPESGDGRIYNTCYVFSPAGEQVARHRKMHLFDIDVKGGQYFKESDTFTPGNDVTVFEAEGVTFGVSICFDIRFPELARLTAVAGARVLVTPGAFNMTTGPMHWELAFRQRAVDNQFYTAAISPARDKTGVYVAYGHSMVCSPWGKVLQELGPEPGTIVLDLDIDEVARVRQQLPLMSALRNDVYKLELL